MDNEENVTIKRDQLFALLEATQQIRSCFLMCAPRFSPGSNGDRIFRLAIEIGKTVDDVYSQMKGTNQ